jgi:hypothetical protein
LTLLVPPGEIKVKWHRDLPVETRLGAVVLQRSCGRWYVCFHAGTPVSWDRLGSVGEPSLWYLNWGQEPGQINRHLGRRNRAGAQVPSRKQRRRQYAVD